MQNKDVIKIFNENKDSLLDVVKSTNNPKAFFTSGQPASGKGLLASKIKSLYPNDTFIFINGDDYREYHPNFEELQKFPDKFTSETQIFCNLFKIELVKEAIKNKYNFILEGTMADTGGFFEISQALKNNGFSIDVFSISAPELFTEIGIYNRYQDEVNFKNYGRIVQNEFHKKASSGLLNTLDELYKCKTVDSIHLYSYLAKEHIASYILEKNNWDIKTLPSNVITQAREIQLKDEKLIKHLIDKGTETLKNIDIKYKPEVNNTLSKLKNILNNILDNKKEKELKPKKKKKR